MFLVIAQDFMFMDHNVQINMMAEMQMDGHSKKTWIYYYNTQHILGKYVRQGTCMQEIY